MKKQFFSFLVLLSFVLSVSAQKVDRVDQNLRTNVAYLASTPLEGRRTGEQGATMAAGYVANLFAQYGLKPGISATVNGKTTRNFLQKFAYTTGVEFAPTGNEFKLEAASAAIDTTGAIRALLSSPNGEVNAAAIVFAGFGIESAESNYNDFDGLDVAGKVMLVFDGNPENDSPRSAFSRFSVHAKAKLAKDKGAAGLILISRDDKFSDDRNLAAKYDQSVGETAVPVFAISRSRVAEILGIKEAELKTIENVIKLRKDTTAKIRLAFRDTAPKVSFKVNLVKKTADAYNVIGVIEGNDPALKNEAVIIGAHYDHLGRGGAGSLAVNSTDIHYGADDNASGTAAMLEIARQFSDDKKKQKRTVIFIGFGGEEEGLLGSKFYVNNPIFPLDKTVAMLNMDMVGRLTDDKLTVGGIGTATEWKDLVTAKNEVIVSPVQQTKGNNLTTPAPESVRRFNLQLNEDGFGPSDHSSFYGKQIPVLFFFTGTHADYHKPSDTADKINYDGLRKLVVYVADLAGYLISDMSKRPTYKVAQTSGQGDGRRGFNVTIGVVPGYGETNDGMAIDGVRDGSPAAVAGLKAGDKIVKFAGKEIRNVQDYTFILGELKADTEYEIVVMRGTERVVLKVKPAARK